MKSPLYLTENLRGCQQPLVLWHWPVDLLSQKEEKKKENQLAKQHFDIVINYKISRILKENLGS